MFEEWVHVLHYVERHATLYCLSKLHSDFQLMQYQWPETRGIIQGLGIVYFDSSKDQGNNQGREIFKAQEIIKEIWYV